MSKAAALEEAKAATAAVHAELATLQAEVRRQVLRTETPRRYCVVFSRLYG